LVAWAGWVVHWKFGKLRVGAGPSGPVRKPGAAQN